jgi:predicted nucleotidyltransferase
MLTKETILNTLRLNKSYFEKELGVVRIGLFGSYAKDLQQPESDVDILVELDEPSWQKLCAVWDILEKQLSIKVDLIRKGPHLREKFLKTLETETIYA